MGVALETINALTTPASTVTTLPFGADPAQSLSIRSSNGSPSAYLFGIWGQVTIACQFSIYSPRMHDDVHGIQTHLLITNPTPSVSYEQMQPMYSQDAPTVSGTFASAPGDAQAEQAGYNIYYSDLPGINANLQSWAQVQPQIKSFYGVEVSTVSSATAGAYGAGSAINSVYDNFKANQPYAILGYTVTTACGNVAIQGSDTGNLLVGGPGSTSPIETRDYFVRLSLATGLPLIPVINSANKQSTNVFTSHTTATSTTVVNLLLAYLGP